MIIELCITVFITQLIFIGFRTWNVRAVADKNLPHVLISGAVVHISWLVGIAIGAKSMNEIISNWSWEHVPVVVFSLAGGLLGSYFGMKKRKPSKT